MNSHWTMGQLNAILSSLQAAACAIMFEQSERQAARRRALLAYGIRLISAALAYVMQVALARWMGSYEYGVYVFVWAWILIGGTVSTLGLNGSVLRVVPEYEHAGRHDLLRGFVLASRAIVIANSVLLSAIGIALVSFPPGWVDEHFVLPLYIIALCMPLHSLADFHDGLGRTRGWIMLALLPTYIMRPLILFSLMFGAIIYGFPATAVTATCCAVIATWSASVMQWAVIRYRLRRLYPPGPRTYQLRYWVTLSLPFLLVGGFFQLISHIDTIILGMFVAPQQVAIYFAAAKTISLVSFVTFAVAAAMTHKYSEYKAMRDAAKLQAVIHDSIRWTLFPSIGVALVILALGYPLLALFGPDFTSGYPVMFVLAIGLVARAVPGPIENILNMLGEQKACAAVIALSLLINIVLNFSLIPAFGAMGAAAATSTSLVVESILLVYVAHRRLGINVLLWRRRPNT